MPESDNATDKLKWITRQRLQYIEMMAYYTGVISRSDLAKAFGISDAAATKDLKLYNQIAPNNLLYQHSEFGFVPAEGFKEKLADLSPEKILPLMAANLPIASLASGQTAVYGITVEQMPLPARLPTKEILAPIIRAIKQRKKLHVRYHSLSSEEANAERILEPHALINNGLRWHVRAYNEQSFDFRDFVLSRFIATQCLASDAESDPAFDDDWVETLNLKLAPHPALSAQKQRYLLTDYGVTAAPIMIEVRRALVGYLLQQLSVDTTPDHSLNPQAHQLILTNRDDIEAYAAWAFR